MLITLVMYNVEVSLDRVSEVFDSSVSSYPEAGSKHMLVRKLCQGRTFATHRNGLKLPSHPRGSSHGHVQQFKVGPNRLRVIDGSRGWV